MALPPKGDPRRPLHLAIRSTRILGGIGTLIGSCVFIPVMMRLRGGRGVFAPRDLMIFGALFYMVPGVLLIVFSVFMGRRRLWAVVGALVMSSLAGVFLLFVGAGLVMSLVATRQTSPVAFILGGVWAIFALAVGQLIYHLAHSFEGIKHPPFGKEFRGFEVLPAAPVVMPGPGVIGPEPFVPAPPQPPPDPADGRDATHDTPSPR
jgi:hypothetical protein